MQPSSSLKYCVLAFILCLSLPSFAQKRPVLTEEEQVQEAVRKEVDELIKSPDFLKKKSKKFSDVKGYIIVDIAVVQNGKLSSFAQSKNRAILKPFGSLNLLTSGCNLND